MLPTRIITTGRYARAGLSKILLGSSSCYFFYKNFMVDGPASSTSERGDALLATSAVHNGFGTSVSSIIIPTIEATFRVVRLASTACLIAIDYKTADLSLLSSLRFNDGRQEEREYWESQTEKRRRDLEKAQKTYSANSHPHLDLPGRLEAKRKEKEAMNEAAIKLAEADEHLAAVGSRKSLIHRRAAHRLLNLCCRNGGVYIKVGQHLANLDYLIPQEYIEVLSVLFDNTPTTDIDQVRIVMNEELRANPEDLFDAFDPVPIASASLAQVHVAYAKGTKQKLAVKIQHRGLRETAAGDIFALVTVVRVAERLFPGFTYGWIADEIAPQLPKELDFTREGKNAERAAANIKRTGLDCIIPKIIWELSSSRVLTMEFEEGFKATDTDAIEEAGLKRRDVAKLVSSVFSAQVFHGSDGWVHCDPHPANVLLRANNGKPQMVLVDHGLYRELDNDFRIKYARLWKSLMLADLDGIKESCRNLGVEEAYTLFAAILLARPFDEIVERSKNKSLRSSAKVTSRADRAVIQGYAQKFLRNIFDLLATLPREMLLLLKMNDCLRHIDYSLGSPTNTMIVYGYYASRAVFEDSLRGSKSWTESLQAWYSYMRVLVQIHIHDVLVWCMDNARPLLRI